MTHEDDEDPALQADADAEAWSLLAAALPPHEPLPELRDRLLAQLRGPDRFAPFVRDIASAFGLSREAIREAFACIPDGGRWQPGPWPGAQLLSTPELAAAHTVIARLPAAVEIPRHGHASRELTFVLDGALVEDGQRRLDAGELLLAEPGYRHAIAAVEDCLVVFGLLPSQQP
jgi:quercetin dioxygenase-like cupin family protein